MVNSADHGGDNADRLLAEAIVDDAVRRRRAANWDRRRALDDVTVGGTLAANVGGTISLVVTTGEELAGTVLLAGTHVVHLEAVGALHWVRADSIVAVTPGSGRLASTTSGAIPAVLADEPIPSLLADLVDGGRTVELRLDGGAVLRGTIEAVGESIVVADSAGARSVVQADAVVTVALPS